MKRAVVVVLCALFVSAAYGDEQEGSKPTVSLRPAENQLAPVMHLRGMANGCNPFNMFPRTGGLAVISGQCEYTFWVLVEDDWEFRDYDSKKEWIKKFLTLSNNIAVNEKEKLGGFYAHITIRNMEGKELAYTQRPFEYFWIGETGKGYENPYEPNQSTPPDFIVTGNAKAYKLKDEK